MDDASVCYFAAVSAGVSVQRGAWSKSNVMCFWAVQTIQKIRFGLAECTQTLFHSHPNNGDQ